MQGFNGKRPKPVENSVELKRVQVKRGFEILANDLREQILTGKISAGQLLPNERELGEQTGLSRNSVREALRILEAQDLVSTALGRYGGRMTLEPGTGLLETSINILLRRKQVLFSGVLETIEILEPPLAGLAAGRRTEGDIQKIAALTQALTATSDAAEFHALNAEWHLTIAAASNSYILAAILNVLGRRLHDPHVEGFASSEVREQVLQAHERIERAIVDQDSEAACRRMARHVYAYSQRVQTVGPTTIDL
jgi:GntR family transcriptional repressor for pyruvate dehydrogenase complex